MKKYLPNVATSERSLRFEALEPRVLFDAAPDVSVTVDDPELTIAEDQFVNDDINFEIEFDNTGDAVGYAPYVDFIAKPEMEIKSVTVYGAAGANPAGASVDPIGKIAADGQLVDISTDLPVDHPMFSSSIGAPSSDYFGGAGSGTPPVQYDVIANPDLIGQYVYSVELPFGSFTPGNFPASVRVTAGLDTADGIVPNQNYELTAVGGFALGQDALDNPGTVAAPTDAPLFGSPDSDTAYPYVIDLLKTASVFEDDGPYTGEMPSGPNFPITYRLEVNIAAGETIDNLVIEDLLPDDLAYTGNLNVSFGAGTSGPRNITINNEPTVNTDDLTGVPAADDTLRITIDSITGQDPNSGASVIVTYTAFVPYQEEGGTLVIDPIGGEENDLDPEYNNASVSGTWSGNAVGDDAGPIPGSDPDGLLGDVETDYIIEEHSIAIQKNVGFATGGDRAVASTINPRDVLEYDLNFQISDYFAFTDVVVDDVLGDGQDFLPGDGSNVAGEPLEVVPELTFQMDGTSVTVAFDPANFSWVENLDGTTDIQFDVYQQLVDSGFIAGGEALRGGYIPDTGILPANLGSHNGGATQGTITYRVQVRESFTAGSQQQISQGDSLTNSATITGINRDITTFAPLVPVTDDTGSSISIPIGNVGKVVDSVFSHGSIIPFGDDDDPSTEPVIGVTAGDLVTYRITYQLPLTEFENLRFQDYLPLPIFDVSALDDTQIYDYDPVLSFTQPGRVSWGSGDTFVGPQGPNTTGDGGVDDNPGYTSTTGITASIDKTTLAGDNGFIINIGSYHPGDGNDSVATTVELLVTIPVIDGEYADRLLFTNQVASAEQNTPGTVSETDEIAQIILVQPELNIKKGVTAVTNPDGNFSQALGPAGVTFNAPGSGTAFSGTIHSDGLAAQDIDANLSNIDAGDLVTFFVVVENTGTSQYGAFDVSIIDNIPTGFAIPGSGANLRVTDGTGAALAFTGDLFTTPLELTDPSANQGAVGAYDATNGTNLVVIAYDLEVQNTVDPREVLTNVAEVESYAASEGGFDHADPGELTDDATVQVAAPALDKIIVDTSHDDTFNVDGQGEVAIGEVVTYQVTITVPEGEMQNVRVIDNLPDGMAFVGLDSVTISPALTSSLGNLQTDVRAFYNANARTMTLGINGQPSGGFGTVTNSDTNNAADETIVFTYRAVVLNDSDNDRGVNRSNDAEIRWTLNAAEQVVQDGELVRIVEPDVTVSKSVVGGTTNVEGAEEITYEIVVTNNNVGGRSAEAYDVTLEDILPGDVSYVAASVTHHAGVAPDVGTLLFDGATGPEGTIRATWSELSVGESSTIRVTVRIDDGLATNTAIQNDADIEYTSLPGTIGDPGYTGFDPATDFGPNANFGSNPATTIGVERTGDPADPGQENDYNATDAVTVTVANPDAVAKAITDTSEAHTGQDASAAGTVYGAIGEVVRFEVRVRLPQAENQALQVIDTLDAGLFWIDAANNDLTLRLDGFSNPANLAADPDVLLANGSTVALDPARVSFNAGSNTVTFDFGDITNLETDAGDEFLVIGYNAIVRNDAGVTRGDVLNNTAQVYEQGVAVGAVMQQSVTVVEPSLSITKTDNGTTIADAGDVIDYTITVTSDSDANATRAFDVAVSDTVPAELEIVGGAVTIVGLPAGSSVVSNTVVGQDINVVVDQLDPGESFQITFQARVRDTGANQIHSDETVTNSARLDYSSLPGDGTNDGVGDNTTGNEAGAAGDPDGERLYNTSANDSFTTPAPVLSKVLANPADTDYTIGEQVEYVITLSVPEGRVGDPLATIVDTIDPGFSFVAGSLSVTTDAGVSVGTAGTLNEANGTFFTHTDPGDTSQSESLDFDFGYIDFNNATSLDGGNTATIEIRYRLQVENILANQEGDQLNNIAVFNYTDEDGVTTNVLNDSTGNTDTIIDVVEPTLTVAKSITSIPANPDAGDTVTYEVVITNTSTETAYDVTFIDQTPSGVDFELGTFTATLNEGLPSEADVTGLFTATASGSITANAGALDIDAGDIVTLTYNVTIPATIQDGVLLVNEADIEWTTMDGSVAGERTGDGNPNNPVAPTNPNDYEDESSAQFRADLSPLYAFTKEVASTSEAHTGTAAGTSAAITDLVVGETVVYRLTAILGRGTTDNVQIFDTLDIANGRLDIRSVTVTAGAALTRQDGNPWDNDVTISDALGGGDGYNDSVQIDFGTVVNDASGTGAAEQIVVLIEAVVVNDLENQGGDVINNEGELRFLEDTDQDGIQETRSLTDDVDVEIVEPAVDVTKTVTSAPANPNAGDTIVYRVVIENTSAIDAFDLTFRDLLPAQLELQTGTFTATRQSDGFVVNPYFSVGTGSVTQAGSGFDLAAGDRITITYSATILPTVTDGLTLTNEADVEWTSINGANADERGGDGDFDNAAGPANPDDYESEDEASVTANLSPQYAITKEVFSTSATHTGIANGTAPSMTDLTIGERVTWVITVTMAEGTTNGVVITDILDTTQGAIAITGARISAGSNLTTSAAASFAALTPTYFDDNVDTHIDRFVINAGTVVNDASGTNPEDGQIRIEIDGIVRNMAVNQDGDVINNLGRLTVLEDTDGDGNADDSVSYEDDVDVEIVEPSVSVAKSITSVPANPDAGDTVSYQVVITNTGDIDAFDLTFSDILPAELDLVTASFTAQRSDLTNVASFFTVSTDSVVHAGAGFDLAAGQSITLTYNATILETVRDGQSLTNEADIEWTSTDGTNADERGGDGDPDNTATGVNDYEDEDADSFQANLSPLYAFTKEIASTSESHTGIAAGTNAAITDLVVGETVVYRLTATLGRGTTDNVQIFDVLDIANGRLDIRNVTVSAGAALTRQDGNPWDNDVTISDALGGGDGYNDSVQIDFGTVVNDSSGTGADEQIVILIEAVVVNNLENQDGDVINNEGELRFLEDTDQDGIQETRSLTDDVDVEIVEPAVTITKSIPLGTTTADAGDVVGYRIVIENTSDIDAFDLVFRDLLPAEMEILTGTFTAQRSDLVNVAGLFDVTTAQITHAGGGFDLAAGQSITINYNATVLATVTDGLSLINEADVEWTSTDGANADERGGDGDFDNPAVGVNDYESEDDATITADIAPLYGFTKSILSTSASHTGTAFGTSPTLTDLVIGETVTYRLVAQMGRGTTPSVVIEDILALTNGILDIRDVRVSAGAAISLQSGAAIGTIIPVLADSNADTYTDQVTIDFGAVINNPALSSGVIDEQIVIEIDAVVVNVLANQDGDVINNLGRLTVLEDTDGDGNADDSVSYEDDVDVEIVEPSVSVAKTVTSVPANPDAGDTVSYQVVITNTGDIDAFDLTFSDILPAELDLVTASFTAQRSDLTNVASFFTVSTDSVVHAGAGFDLAAGQSITLTYNATILETVRDGQSLTNEADIEWTSTDGANPDERGGDGDPDNTATGVDDYEDEDDATFQANLSPLYAFTKEIASTSESHTGTAAGTSAAITDLVVGETVVYRLTATLGRGTTDNVQIFDVLDIANGRLDIRSVTVSAGAALTRQDGNPWDNDVTISDALGGGDGYNDSVQIDFGTVVNDASGTGAAEQIVILIEAVVVNDLENQDGDVVNNEGELRFLEDTDQDGIQETRSITDDVDVEIVEPTVSVAKSITTVPANPDAGDTVTYRIVIENTSDVDAFDITFRDLLPAELDLDTGSFTAIRQSGLSNVASWFNVTADEITHAGTGFDLAAGDSITITYDATILATVRDGQDLANEADIEWTSTDGINADERGGDGDFDHPAVGVNDYEDESDATFRADLDPVYDFTKEIVATSETHTGIAAGTDPSITDLTIGETVTYRLTATLGRGTTDNVQIFDILDIANGRLDIRSVTVSAGAALSRADANDWDANVTVSDSLGGDGYNDTVQIDFNTVVNDPALAGDLKDEQIVVIIEAVVVNDAENQDGDVVNNVGEFRFLQDIDEDGVQEQQVLSDDVDVEIVEPEITVSKSVVTAPADPNAGDTVRYQVIVENTGDIDAFEVDFRDALPAELDLQTGTFTAIRQSDGLSVATWFNITADGITNGFKFDLEVGDRVTITYDAVILPTVTDGLRLVNEADAEWTSINGANGDERTGDGDFDNPANGANDYESGQDATVIANLSPQYDFTKEILSTSAAHTGTAAGTDPGITDLVVGETVTYVLTATLGEGTTNQVFLSDRLNTGQASFEITGVRVTGGSNLTTAASASFETVTVNLSDSDGNGFNDRFFIDFLSVVNDASGADPEDGQIRIEVDARVLNLLGNDEGDVVNNVGVFQYTEDLNNDGLAEDPEFSELTDDVDVEIVEPAVTVTKSIPSGTTEADAGDVIGYRIVIENPSETDAFDLTFRDLLPAQMDADTTSFTAIRDSDGADVSAFFTVGTDVITHAGTGFDLAAGDFITIDYDATVLATVTDGASLVNEVDIEWTSLDGDDPGERGGDGDFDTPADPTDPNQYEDGDESEITGELSPLYDFSKSIFATSESHTGSAFGTDPAIEDLVIGETVTYELVAQLGRGTTPSVVIEDFLALTNGILDIRAVRVEIGSAVTVTSSNPVITDSNADTYDDQVLIDFGSVVNDPTLSNGPADEQIRVYIDAVVVNILANQDGDVINNLGRLTVLEDTDGDGDADDPVVREDNVDVEIVEPTLDVAKRITAQPLNPDGADTVSYEVVITNTGDIDAFEVTFLDDLPTKVALDTGSFTAIRDSDGADVSAFFALAAESVAHSGAGFTLEAGDFITLTYDVTILETIKDGDRQTNLVDIEWTSTDGVNADERGGDGDYDNPADPGDPNNYEDEDQTTFIANLVGYDFEKTVFTTSLSHTGDGQHDPAVTDLTIGETVTYALTATFPEGTTPSVSIIDILNLSEGILDIESVSISAGVNLSSDQGAINGLTPLLEDTNGDGFMDKMTLVFGEVTNDASDSIDPSADQLVVYVTARVVNIIENRDGDVICNSGTFTYQEDINDDGTIDIADPATNIEDCADVELVEPDLTIDKSVNNDKPKLAETLTYTLTVTNDATTGSADGFDLEILDRLPVGLTLDPASVTLTHVGAPVNPSTLVANTSDGQNLRLQLDRLDLGEQIIITYEATVTSDISYYMAVLPNEADLEWTSTPGDTPDERGGDGDPDTDADPTLTPDFYDDNDEESVEVHQPDLKIVKRDGGVQIRPGQTVTYTMEVTNQGRATALDVTVTDNINRYLAEGFQFVGASDGGRLNGAGVVTWNLPDLAVDESMTIRLTLLAPRVVPAGVEEIHNIAVADHLDIEPSPDDNRDREDTPITAFPDLVVTKDDGLTHATVGDLVTYRISFDNVGNQVASGVVIRDTLPPGVKFVSASDGGRLRGNTVVWELGELRPGGGDTFTVVVEILTDGEKLNIVTIEDDGRGGPDPTPKNNRDTDITIGKKGFQFDLNQNFLFSNGNQNVIGGSFRSELMRLYPEFDFLQDSRIPIVLGTHMNSGLAQPGSTITLEVYNDRGERIAEQSVIADTGGNWLATFVTDKIDQQPARIVMKQTWSTPNVGDDTGYNFRTYFAPTFSTASYYSEELSIWNVTGKRAATEVLDLYEASKNILHLDWNGTTYEFNSRGGLQSASGN